ncbi:peroxiredoxin [Deltaproteobacteria bacterium PRO3]|nr:peroxiredoxin [Deltaproteobacteria bacterium PRO3]
MRQGFLFLAAFLIGLGAATAAELKVGAPAPDFSTVDEQGRPVSLKDFRGKAVVLYFYPKDDTPGCTVQAQSFRDHYGEFQNLETVVLGVSFDSQESHKKFKDKHGLPFPLLVDADRKIAQAYGVKGTFFASRDVIVIDADGKIAKILRSVNPSDVVGILLKDAK